MISASTSTRLARQSPGPRRRAAWSAGGFCRARPAQMAACALRSRMRPGSRAAAHRATFRSTGIFVKNATRPRIRRMALRIWLADEPRVSRPESLDGAQGARVHKFGRLIDQNIARAIPRRIDRLGATPRKGRPNDHQHRVLSLSSAKSRRARLETPQCRNHAAAARGWRRRHFGYDRPRQALFANATVPSFATSDRTTLLVMTRPAQPCASCAASRTSDMMSRSKPPPDRQIRISAWCTPAPPYGEMVRRVSEISTGHKRDTSTYR